MVEKIEKPEDPTHCMIHELHDVVAQELHAEMQKDELDDRSFQKILYLIKTAAKLQARIAGKVETQIAQDTVEEILKGTQKVASHINGWIPIGVTCLTAVLQLASGAVGGYAAAQGISITGNAPVGLNPKTLTTLLEPSRQWTALSQSVGSVAGFASSGKDLAKNYDDSKRTIEQHLVDERKRVRDERQRDANRQRDALQEMHRSIEQSNSVAHDTFSKMCH